jgi:putative PIG3 family NAD(P)H quinone oxidoreductase
MRAVVLTGAGGPDVLRIQEVPTPEPGWGQVRVRVRSAGLNRADLLQRQGHYPAPPDAQADIPGLEFAGEVEKLGPGATDFKLGEYVFGIVGGGGQAEFVVVPERTLVRVPASLDPLAAGGVPEAFITAHDALFTQGQLRLGERLLIHAVGSGLGTAMVQLARAASCTVLGTARSENKLERAEALGMDIGIHAPEGRFAAKVREATNGAGVNMVADVLGGGALHENLASLSYQGRMVVIGLMSGSREEVDLSQLLTRRLKLWGTVLRSRPLEEKIAATRAFSEQVVPLLARGVVKPVIDRVYPAQAVQAAHQQMARNENFGKIVLTF